MKNKIELYDFQGNQIRIIVNENFEPNFCLIDICSSLGLTNPTVTAQRLDADEVTKFDLGGRTGVTNFVTESGMYSVVMRSDSIKAKPFQKWVTSDVLPAIRKHGAYMTPETIEKVLLDPDMIISLANQLKDAREELKVAQPKLILASAIEASKDSILVGQLAKILNQNGISIGQNRLFKWMRISGYLCSRGNNYNRPTQTSMDRGLFEVQEMTISVPGRDHRISFTTKVTGKGQLYFVNRFLKNERIAV